MHFSSWLMQKEPTLVMRLAKHSYFLVCHVEDQVSICRNNNITKWHLYNITIIFLLSSLYLEKYTWLLLFSITNWSNMKRSILIGSQTIWILQCSTFPIWAITHNTCYTFWEALDVTSELAHSWYNSPGVKIKATGESKLNDSPMWW